VIVLTRLNGSRFVLNAELIRTVEETPDTTIRLTTGDSYMVRESMEEVVGLAVDYGRLLRGFLTPN
jgi:flagellar protein FlbD